MRKFRWKQWGIIFLVCIALSVSGCFAYIYHMKQQREQVTEQYQKFQEKGQWSNQLSRIITKNGFIKKEIKVNELDSLIKKMEQSQQVIHQYNAKTHKLDEQIVNQLIRASNIVKDKIVIENQLKELINYKDYLSHSSPNINKIILSDEITNDELDGFIKNFENNQFPQDDWNKRVKNIITEMSKQNKQLANAKSLVSKLFKKNKVITDVTDEMYEQALTEVQRIKQEKTKKILLTKLKQVQKSLESKSQEIDNVQLQNTPLLQSLEEAQEYLAEHMPQAGGPQQFVNGRVTEEGYYSFDYQLFGDNEGVIWHRIVIDNNKNTISDEFLKRVDRDKMYETFEYYQENDGGTLSQNEAMEIVINFHNSLGRPSATLFGSTGDAGGYTIQYMSSDDRFIYTYFVNDDGSVEDRGVTEIIYEDNNEYAEEPEVNEGDDSVGIENPDFDEYEWNYDSSSPYSNEDFYQENSDEG